MTRLEKVMHSADSDSCPPGQQEACKRRSIISIAGEILALSMTDAQVSTPARPLPLALSSSRLILFAAVAQVVTAGSGVGRMAATISGTHDRAYLLTDEDAVGGGVVCNLRTHTRLEDIYQRSAGI